MIKFSKIKYLCLLGLLAVMLAFGGCCPQGRPTKPEKGQDQPLSQYGTFPGQPWPVQFVAENPFALEILPQHANVKFSDWSRVVEYEKNTPTFTNGGLNIADKELDARWRDLYVPILPLSRRSQIIYVNHFMNQFKFVPDRENWGRQNYWAAPGEFLAKKSGDCEDYAIAKYFALKALGVPIDDMYLATVNNPDSKQGVYHSILVVKDGADWYVLDNFLDKGVTVSSSYKKYTVYNYFNENMGKKIKNTAN